jgi:hypothetical protein
MTRSKIVDAESGKEYLNNVRSFVNNWNSLVIGAFLAFTGVIMPHIPVNLDGLAAIGFLFVSYLVLQIGRA